MAQRIFQILLPKFEAFCLLSELDSFVTPLRPLAVCDDGSTTCFPSLLVEKSH